MPMANDEATLFPIQVIDNTLVCDSRVIAKELGIDHHSFLKNIERHKVKLESRFGILRLEVHKKQGRGRPSQSFQLTEQQATAICTLSDNTDKVVDVKFALTSAFFDAREKQLESRLHSDDDAILGYMALLREKTELVKSFDDALKLQSNFADFLNEYKAIQDQKKILNNRLAILKASIVSSNTSISISGSSASNLNAIDITSSIAKPTAIAISDIGDSNSSNSKKAILPSQNQVNLSLEEMEILAMLLKELRPNREKYSSRRPKGKTPFSTSLSDFEERCKSAKIAYTVKAIESILESTGWKRDGEQSDRWNTYF